MWTENDVLKAIEIGRLQKNNIQNEPGASRDSLANTESRLGLSLPSDLKRWLGICNGAATTYGTVFGVSQNLKPNPGSIEQVLSWESHKPWLEKLWIPVADDGCGSHYVIVESKRTGLHPIVFIDFADEEHLNYVVASNLFAFLRGFFLQTVDVDDPLATPVWPFDREWAKKNDPAIFRIIDIALPWNLPNV
jgi:cell wall assembly regulator SMI1